MANDETPYPMSDSSDVVDESDDDFADDDDVELEVARREPQVIERLVVEPTMLIAGGEALARDADGRVVFVRGALPGEQVEVQITDRRKEWARAEVESILIASPSRVEPPCPSVAAGCGGCDLQHANPTTQPEMKAAMVIDALKRLGGIENPQVEFGPSLPAEGFRTTVRAAVVDGRAGLRRHHAHDVVFPEHCLVAHPLLNELLVSGDFAEAKEVTLRIGAVTGDRMALVDPSSDGVVLPRDVLVVGTKAVKAGRRAWIHDEVAGRRWRISARSFFQTRTDGAEALVDAVARSGGDAFAGAHLVDAYAGVGMFAGSLLAGSLPDGVGRPASAVVVERSASSIADARHNLEGLEVRIVKADLEKWSPSNADIVVADPARAGLGRKAVTALATTGASVVVLVSCDPASFGRDTKLLTEAGFRLERAELVDLFPQTHHVEVVSRFFR
ncbi:MAG: TRAM domain-containing protein [Actinomycetes bacterium]